MSLFLLKIGGVEGDRTPDLMTASHALSQLSYDPVLSMRTENEKPPKGVPFSGSKMKS